MVLGGFVEFGKVAAVSVSGCGCCEEVSFTSFEAILQKKTKDNIFNKHEGKLRNYAASCCKFGFWESPNFFCSVNCSLYLDQVTEMFTTCFHLKKQTF